MDTAKDPRYIISININHNIAGLHSIKGFLATGENEEYNANNPMHLNSTVAWLCWDQMIKSILQKCDDDVDLAIKVTQRDYKLQQGKNILYMRKHAREEDVSYFIAQVDNFIKVSLLLGSC